MTAPNQEGWIPHDGGPSPVDFDRNREIMVRTRDGAETRKFSIICGWFRQGWDDDVLAYRIIDQVQP